MATQDRVERCIERSQGGTLIKKVVSTRHGAVAGELSEALDGLLADDVDIIRCDETGRIVEFRMTIRPRQPIDAVHEQLRAMFASKRPQLHPDER